jgi:ABC-type nitrate/sulfonate/bicarbonate transport system substrate-binding protein
MLKVCLVVFGSLILLPFLSGCGETSSSSSTGKKEATASTPAKEKEEPTVCRLAYTQKGYYAPQFLAARHGWFAADGVKIQEVRLGMSAGIAGAEALVSGSADVAVMGDVPALIALESARECVLVAAYCTGERMHSIVVTEKANIKTPADLVGKKLGVQFGSSTHGAVYLYLEHHGINPASISLMNIPQKDLIEALISGSIDALAASKPTPLQVLQKVPGTTELACLSGLGNNYPFAIVASRAYAEAHPEAIRAIVAGTRKVIEWMNADPDTAARETAEVTGASAEIEAATFREMEWRVRLDQQIIESLNKTAAFLVRTGKLKSLSDVTPFCRKEFVEP